MPEQENTVADGAVQARRWKKELMLAEKRERDWERESDKIVKRYRGEEKKRNRYNVLWANTEILRPAVYNSRPNPDVRRRFREADPAGKAVSEVLERSLQVFVDGDAVDDSLSNDVLDGLLCGRGVSRVRYVPKITTTPKQRAENDDEIVGSDEVTDQSHDKPDAVRPEGEEDSDAVDLPDEEVESETVELEHVDWKDFRHGYGRVWAEVPWVSFRHKLTRAEAEEKFGREELEKIEFTTPVGDDYKKPGDQVGETDKVAEFWEIWDKVRKRVFFTHDSVERLLYPVDNPDGEPPLDFDGFFPNPRPLMMVENTGSLLPTPPFRLYEDQAADLDEITFRIKKIVKSMRLRGVYDAKMPEMKDLLSSDDNEMIPIQNAQAWKDGGLDNAVSWFPVEKNAEILEALYAARDKQKAIIDELTGIADIMRGATDPNETLGAQELKSTYGSVRLQRMQKEVQRYARDVIRLAASAMSQKFTPSTFTAMTELDFPTLEQKNLLKAMFAARAQTATMMPPPMAAQPHTPPQPPGAMPPPGAPPPHPAMGMPAGAPTPGAPQPQIPPQPAPMIPGVDPGMLNLPTWEDILGIMRSDKRRQYKIDVETDSTVAGTLSSDMAGLSQVLTAISQAMQELAPMVQQGVLPVDAAKEIILTVIRRSRMGIAVEDAFDKLQAPHPPSDPNAGKLQEAQAKAQADIEVAKIKAALDAQVAQAQQQAQEKQNQQEQLLESQRASADAQLKMQLDAAQKQHLQSLEQIKMAAESQRQELELETQRMIADANNQTKVMIARIAAGSAEALQSQKIQHEQAMATIQAASAPAGQTAGSGTPSGDAAPTAASYDPQESHLGSMIKELTAQMSRPRRVIRDANGKIAGVE